MDIRVEPIPPMRLAGLEHHGPLATIGETWTRLNEKLASHPELFGPMTMHLSVFYDAPSSKPEQEQRSMAAITLADTDTPPDGFQVEVIHGAVCAIAMHRGPYTGLGEAWKRLIDWARERDHALAPEPCFEIYRTDPRIVAPANLKTELYLPIVSRST